MSRFTNPAYLNALQKIPQQRTPIWLMRQAGRYLPEYRTLRSKVSDFLDLCKNPKLACEATLQPLARYDLDAAILFSDILTIPDAMQRSVHFVAGEGPKMKPLLQEELSTLDVIHPESDLPYVLETVDLIVLALGNRIPLIGFSGSPFTLACYMIEGGGSKQFDSVKQWLYQTPDALHALLKILAQNVYTYLRAQALAGCASLMLFDTWGGLLTPSAYRDYSLAYMRQIIDNLRQDSVTQDIPITIFTKGGGLHLEQQIQSKPDAIGIDWMTDLGWAFSINHDRVALQGNLEPSLLLAPHAVIRETVQNTLQMAKFHPGYIMNLGHGILPHTPPESVSVLIEAVRNFWKHSSATGVPFSRE